MRDIWLTRSERETAFERQRRRLSGGLLQDPVRASFRFVVATCSEGCICSSNVLRKIHGDEFTRGEMLEIEECPRYRADTEECPR